MRRAILLIIAVLGVSAMTEMPDYFDSQGHRGARGLLPENTLPAFARALSIGVTTLELDIGVTRDGIVVVSHNPHLEPETVRDKDGNWLTETGPAIHALTLDELKSFDVGRIKPGSRYETQFPNQAAVDGSRIPTLAEVLDLIKRSGNPNVRVNIETKLRPGAPALTASPREFATLLIRALRAAGMETRATVQSFDWRTLREVQAQAPEVVTSYLTVEQDWFDTVEAGKPGPSPWFAGLDVDNHDGSLPDLIKAAGGKVWSPFYRDLGAEALSRAHSLGLKVKVWTVNDPADMDRLIEMGVDGIITDYPDRLRQVLTKRGMILPMPTPVKP